VAPCPTPSELEAFAAGDPGCTPVGEHVKRCDACRAAVDEINANQRFIAGAGPGLIAAFDAAAAAGPVGAESMLPPPGTVPGFELLEVISRGGQGVVFRAVQTDSKRPAAVKMLLAGAFASGEQLRRFEREIEIAARLRHPYIVSVFASGESLDGRRYVAMEHVPGIALDRFVRERWPVGGGNARARINQIMRLFQMVAEGVGYAHANGVMHRDLKPSNILVDTEGKPRVLDFGLARADDALAGTAVTVEFAGTPAFAAPEQFSSALGPVSTRTDVYALGLVLYRVLTGRHPYPCDGLIAEVSQHAVSTEPTPPSRYLGRLPEGVEAIVLKALSKSPLQRYQTGSAMAADIEDFLAGRPVSARRSSTAYVLRTLAMKHRVVSLAALVVLVTVFAAAIGLALLSSDLDRARRRSEAALSESSVRRARLMATVGDVERAESLLWDQAVRGRMTTDGTFLFQGTPEAIRSAWSLAEFYSRLPRRFRAVTDGLPDCVGIDTPGRTIWAVSAKARRWKWSIDGGLLDAPDRGPTDPYRGVRASPDGRLVAAQTADGFVLRDFESGKAARGPGTWDPDFRIGAVSGDGRWLAFCRLSSDGAVRVFDAATSAVLGEFQDKASSLQFQESPDGPLLLVGTLSGVNTGVVVRGGDDWRVLRTFPLPPPRPGAPTNRVRGPRLTRDGASLIATSEECIWRSGWEHPSTAMSFVRSVSSPIECSDFDELGISFVAGSRDGTIWTFRLPEFEPLISIPNGGAVIAIAANATAGIIAVGDQLARVSVYDTTDRPWLERVPASGATKQSLSVAPDGTIAWGDDEGWLTIRRPGPSNESVSVRAHESEVSSVAFSPDGSRILTAGFDGAIHVWGVDGARTKTIAVGLPRVWCARFSPDGRTIASGHQGGTVRIWKPDASDPVMILTCRVTRVPMVAFSPDGRLLVSAAGVGVAKVWDTATGRQVHQLQTAIEVTRAVAVSPDGRMIATGDDDRSISIWDTQSGEKLRSIDGLPWDIFDVVFSPQGAVLFAVGRGGEVVVMNAQEGTELARLSVHAGLVFSLGLSSDGRRLYTSGQDAWIGVTDLDRLCSYIRGNEAAWRQQLGKGAPGPRANGGRE